MEWRILNTTHTIYNVLRFSEATTKWEGMPINLFLPAMAFTRVLDVMSRKSNASFIIYFTAPKMKKSTFLSSLFSPLLSMLVMNCWGGNIWTKLNRTHTTTV